tara:strand:- start:220 stop:930 length:711 start_codon:yes stop_codon:yes gene_type:complete
MKNIDTAFILCAGFGKRLNPLTLNIPKPLLEINNLTLLENTINLIKNLGINKIKLNTFYLKDKIQYFIEKKNFQLDIKIVEDGEKILDTGGGIYNMMKSSSQLETDFLVFNPDTIWNKDYTKTINEMIKFYFLNSNRNTLLVVDKNLSFDKNLEGDFSIYNNKLIKSPKNKFIFTGCQIINRKVFSEVLSESISNFSILKIWDTLISKKNLFGFESKIKFNHVTNLQIYQKLLKNY